MFPEHAVKAFVEVDGQVFQVQRINHDVKIYTVSWVKAVFCVLHLKKKNLQPNQIMQTEQFTYFLS